MLIEIQLGNNRTVVGIVLDYVNGCCKVGIGPERLAQWFCIYTANKEANFEWKELPDWGPQHNEPTLWNWRVFPRPDFE